MLEIRNICSNEIHQIKNLIQNTIQLCYPAIYTPKVVNFFVQYHAEELIRERYNSGHVVLLKHEGNLVGTAFLVEEELGGVYVNPVYQRNGFGTAIVNHLLAIARKKKLGKIWLDATPLAKPLYDKLGFQLVSKMIDIIEDEELPYYKMEKIL